MNELDPDAELLPRIALGDESAILEMVTKKLSRLRALGVRMRNDRTEPRMWHKSLFCVYGNRLSIGRLAALNSIPDYIKWCLICVTTSYALAKATLIKVTATKFRQN
jgi:hypothetical protein